MDKFETSDEFFDWFLPTIKKHVPNLDELVLDAERAAKRGEDNHKKIIKALPALDSDQIERCFTEIRKIIKIPDNIFLVYDSGAKTYYSRYNTQKRRLEIGFPTYAYYHLRYEPIIKAAMQHEMGHILNRDYKVNEKGHVGCANRCMDIRINHHIDREWLRDLFDAVYYFRTQKFTMLVPEEVLPSYGLMLKKHGTYSYQVIHKYYHLNDSEKQPKKPKPPMEYKMPEVGDVVKINKTQEYGKVTAIKDGKAIVEKMTIGEVKEHFKNQDGSGYGEVN